MGAALPGGRAGAFGITFAGRRSGRESWDLADGGTTRPPTCAASARRHPLSHPRTAAATVGLAAFLLLAYLTLIALMRLHRGAVLREAAGGSRPAGRRALLP